MPNMVSDGLIDQAQLIVKISQSPTNSDYNLQGMVSNAITTAALTGASSTPAITISAYATALVQIMVQRLVNMGYAATLTSTTLTVSWS